MSQNDIFQEGQKAYCVRAYLDKIKWIVFEVVGVLPKSLRLQEEGQNSPSLTRITFNGKFYHWSKAEIRPSRKLALESMIDRRMNNRESYHKRMTECEKDLELLQHELLNLKELPDDNT